MRSETSTADTSARKITTLQLAHIPSGKRSLTVCPEFIQGAVRPTRIAAAVSPLLQNSQTRETMQTELERVRTLLNEQAGENAAKLILGDLS